MERFKSDGVISKKSKEVSRRILQGVRLAQLGQRPERSAPKMDQEILKYVGGFNYLRTELTPQNSKHYSEYLAEIAEVLTEEIYESV